MALLQVVERADHGVVERRAAARVDAREGLFRSLMVVGEVAVGVEIILVVEVDDESFILRVAVS